MNLFGLDISIRRRKAAVAPLGVNDFGSMANVSSGRGWWPLVREPFAGAWQRNQSLPMTDVLTHCTAWACITLIAFDIAKMRIKLMREDSHGIATEIDNPAYSPVLRKPNHYQNRIQFTQSWVMSKLTRGNTYVLKERDDRNVVTGLYILDPSRVQVLVAPGGDVFYSCAADNLSGLDQTVVVPASEIIHDIYIAPYHPLCGVPPVFACGLAVAHGLQILDNVTRLFQNGSHPGGVLTAPGAISEPAARRAQEWWDSNFSGADNVGKVAVLGDGLKFERMGLTAVEAEVVKQLNWGDEKVCSVYHVPAYMVGVGTMPNYNNIEALNQQYYAQCLQSLIESIELCLTEGLKLDTTSFIELDLDGLIRMDSSTKMKTTTDGVKGGIYTPNEARRFFNLKPLAGGDTVYLQEQDHALEALAKRDAGPDPFGKAAAKPPAPPKPPEEPPPAEKHAATLVKAGFMERLAA
jgi:HK97 family phage portal protein